MSLSTVYEFEKGQRTPTPNNLGAMRRAIQAAGIMLVFNKDGTGAGIMGTGSNPDLSTDAL